MASAQSGGLTGVPGYVSPPAATSPVIPPFQPVPTPGIPDLPGGVPRVNAPAEQGLLDQFGTLDQKYKFDRQSFSEGLRNTLAGMNYTFEQNPDGTLKINSTNILGANQRKAVQDQKNAGAAKGTLYSSFTDSAIGNSLQQMGKAATEAIAQYGFNIKKSNDSYLGEAQSIGGRIGELLTDDAKWAVENQVTSITPTGSATDAAGNNIIWKGPNYPNLASLQSAHPGQAIDIRRTGDGHFVAILKGPGSGGSRPNIIPLPGKASDLSPGYLSGLASQYPGYKVVRTASGGLVLKKQ